MCLQVYRGVLPAGPPRPGAHLLGRDPRGHLRLPSGHHLRRDQRAQVPGDAHRGRDRGGPGRAGRQRHHVHHRRHRAQVIY